MSDVRQISVFMNNEPGQLADVIRVLKEEGVNIRALSLADTKDFGILRIIVNDTDKAMDTVRKAGFAAAATPIVAISIPDAPGQLSRVLDVLSKNNVNLEYLYAFTGASDRSVSFVIRVDDNKIASDALTKEGIIQLTENDLSEL